MNTDTKRQRHTEEVFTDETDHLWNNGWFAKCIQSYFRQNSENFAYCLSDISIINLLKLFNFSDDDTMLTHFTIPKL